MRSTITALFVAFLISIGITLQNVPADIFYSEQFEKPFHSYKFSSLDEKSVHKRDSSSSVLFQQAEETDQIDDDAVDDGIKMPNESTWWTNATHEKVNHRYYTTHLLQPSPNNFKQYWINIPDLLSNNKTIKGEVQHKQLSNSYRRAVSQKLSFKFPFYGHETENITIATGGFVYVGEHVHSWLAATQYIAPLMANFDTTTSDDSNILYADSGDFFVVEWNQVVLRQQPDMGNFTFQVTLRKNGDIWFVYKNVPAEVKHVSDVHHPKKVGLSDAYLFTHTILTLSRRVIYEYHRVEVPLESVRSESVILIKANPVCVALNDCRSCTNSNLTQFNCSWCSVSVDRGGSFCSDEAGLHRRRQDWLDFQCNKQSNQVYCTNDQTPLDPLQTTPSVIDRSSTSENGRKSTITTQATTVDSKSRGTPRNNSSRSSEKEGISSRKIQTASSGISSGGVVALLFILGIVACLTGWVLYAYYNPQTTSGQLLIRYRPSRWRWPNSHGDVRYTASVHM